MEDAPAQVGNTYYADFLIRVGRINEAISTLERARIENPLDQDIASMLVLAYGSAGKLEAALREADRSLALVPTLRVSSTTSGRGLVALGSRDKSVISKWFREPREVRESIGPMIPNQVGLAYLEDADKALELLRRAANDLDPAEAIPLPTWANYFGDPKLGLEALRRAHSGARTIVVWQLWLPFYADMRRLPGFKDLVSDLGLVKYRRESGNWGDFCSPLGTNDFECD